MRFSGKLTKTESIGAIDKARFENYLALMHNIARKKDELTLITAKLGSPASIKYSDMPRNPNKKKDKIAFLIQEKIEIENDIKALEKYRETEREKLMTAVSMLEDPRNTKKLYRDQKILIAEASVLRLRYFGMFQWSEINDAFHSDEPDFQEKKEDFQRKIFRYHGNAFIDLKKVLQAAN